MSACYTSLSDQDFGARVAPFNPEDKQDVLTIVGPNRTGLKPAGTRVIRWRTRTNKIFDKRVSVRQKGGVN
jgi:hypothetical protein